MLQLGELSAKICSPALQITPRRSFCPYKKLHPLICGANLREWSFLFSDCLQRNFSLSSSVQPADQFKCHFMFQHKRLINGEEYQPAGGGSHRGYDLRCERIEYLPYRISVLHLLPRYAPRTENPPGRCQHCGKVVLVDDCGKVSAVAGMLHHTDPAQIPQYSTHRLRCAFLVYICCLSGIDAERIGLPALPIIFKPNL